jgi:DNA polymerase III delta subunit
MLYLFYGDDSAKKHGALDALTAAGTGSIFFASKGDEYDAIIDEHVASASLFGEKSVIVFDDALADKDARAMFLDRMEILSKSENIFVFLEAKALKETLTAFAKAKGLVTEFSQKKEKEFGKEANIFALTDSFARKDKKQSWVLLQQAYMAGKSPEELGGLFFWQLKQLLLVKDPRASAAALNMKPFVFSKASAAARLWEKTDLEKASSMLVAATHESRRGESEAETALERVILTAF